VTSSDKANKDLDLKLITSRIFRSFGYATWPEVDYFVRSYGTRYARPEVTDLDVVGLAFEGDFTMRTVVAECKSTEHGAAEDILKLLGALTLLQGSRGYLVKQHIADNSRELANQRGVSCFDHDEALHLLNSLEPDAKTKLEGERQGYNAWTAVINSLRNNQSLTYALRYIRRDFWTYNAWENLHNLLYLSESVLLPHLNPQNENHRALMLEFCRLFNISVLKLCNSVLTSRLGQMEREIEVQAFGGPKSRRDRERLYDEIARALPKSNQIPNPLNPRYMPQLKEVVAYYLMSPLAASKAPLALQQALFQNYLGVNSMYYGMLSTEFSEVTIKLAKDSSELLVVNESEEGKEFLSQLLTA